ncbi:cell wall-binding repeat-containing protein [Thermococcus atlanticus]
MKRAPLIILLVILMLTPLLVPAVQAAGDEKKYDLIIVRNDDLIDYIVALPYAKKLGVPILPVNPKELDIKTQAQLQSYAQFGWNHVLIIGNSKAVSDTVQDELMSIGFITERIGGEVRTETAARLAEAFFPKGAETVILASANDYGSALAAARYAMNYGYPLLLTRNDTVSEYTALALKKLKPKLVVMIGAGLSENVEKQLKSMGYETFWYGRNVEITLPKKEERTSPWWYYLIGALISLAVTVPIVLYWAKKKWGENRVPIEVLTEKERIVVKAMLEKGGIVKQEDLPELTGYSRPTISRIIQELEKKQLVSREKVGKTFIVKLIKEIRMRD